MKLSDEEVEKSCKELDRIIEAIEKLDEEGWAKCNQELLRKKDYGSFESENDILSVLNEEEIQKITIHSLKELRQKFHKTKDDAHFSIAVNISLRSQTAFLELRRKF